MQSTGHQISVTGNDAANVYSKVTGNNGLTKTGGGEVKPWNDANDFTGTLRAQNSGNVFVSTIANSNTPSAAGAGSEISFGYNSGLTYTGDGDTTDRILRLDGSGGNVQLYSAGTGPLVLTGPFTNAYTADLALILAGSSGTDGTNELHAALTDSATHALRVSGNTGGIWTLSGTNTFTGDVNCNNQAKLRIGGAGLLGGGSYAGDITLNQNGEFHYSSSATQTFSGTLSRTDSGDFRVYGPGTFEIAGANTLESWMDVEGGTLKLTATNTYSSWPTLNGGTLELGAEGWLEMPADEVATINTDATLCINGGTLTNAGQMTFSGDGTVKVQSGLLTLNGGYTQNSGNPSLNSDMEISGGSIDMGGQVRVGDGVPADFTVTGRNASIWLYVLNQRAWTGDQGTFRFVLDEGGVSPVNIHSYMHLEEATVRVDGANFYAFTETPTNIVLFDSNSIQTEATNVVNALAYSNFHSSATLEFVYDHDAEDLYLSYTPPPVGTVIVVK